MASDHSRDMPPKRRADKSRCSKWQKVKEMVSVTDLILIRDSLAVLQRDIWLLREALDGDFERPRSGLEKMDERVDRPCKKRQSDQRAFIAIAAI
jgi:hypothetical protein